MELSPELVIAGGRATAKRSSPGRTCCFAQVSLNFTQARIERRSIAKALELQNGEKEDQSLHL